MKEYRIDVDDVAARLKARERGHGQVGQWFPIARVRADLIEDLFTVWQAPIGTPIVRVKHGVTAP